MPSGTVRPWSLLLRLGPEFHPDTELADITRYVRCLPDNHNWIVIVRLKYCPSTRSPSMGLVDAPSDMRAINGTLEKFT